MSTSGDVLHEAIRVVAAGVGNPDESRPAAEVAVEAVRTLGHPTDDWRGWHELSMGLINFAMILLGEVERSFDQVPIDVVRAIAEKYPRESTI